VPQSGARPAPPRPMWATPAFAAWLRSIMSPAPLHGQGGANPVPEPLDGCALRSVSVRLCKSRPVVSAAGRGAYPTPTVAGRNQRDLAVVSQFESSANRSSIDGKSPCRTSTLGRGTQRCLPGPCTMVWSDNELATAVGVLRNPRPGGLSPVSPLRCHVTRRRKG
jgi:hypothetical protein